MSDTGAAYFRVGGTPAGPAPPGAGPVAGGGSRQGVGRLAESFTRHRVLWLAGAGAGVVGLALWQSRGTDEDEDRELTEWEIDTRDTDLYNELQPELEEIADQIDESHEDRPPGSGRPRPPVSKPVRHFHRRANTDTDPEREGIWHSHPGGNKKHGHWWLQGPRGPRPGQPRRRPRPGLPRDPRDDDDNRRRRGRRGRGDGGAGDGGRRRRRRDRS